MNIETTLIDDVLDKLRKKDPAFFNAVQNKILQIALLEPSAIQHFKNLRAGLSDHKRVHVGNFVLMFKHRNSTTL